MSIGDELRQAREELGFTLDEVTGKTKIRERYISAMENDNFDVLPGHAYIKGFLRNYAKVLEIDGEALADQYVQLYQTKEESKTTPVDQNNHSKRPLALLVILAVVLGGFLMIGYKALERHDEPGGKTGSNVADEHRGSPGGGQINAGETNKGQTEKDTGVDVSLQVTNSVCWMRILVDEQRVFEGNVEPGTRKTFQGSDSVFVLLGDAGAVKVTVNNEEHGYLGGAGQVVERTFVTGNNPADS